MTIILYLGSPADTTICSAALNCSWDRLVGWACWDNNPLSSSTLPRPPPWFSERGEGDIDDFGGETFGGGAGGGRGSSSWSTESSFGWCPIVIDDRGLLSQQAQPTSLSHEQFRAALQMVVSAGDPRYNIIVLHKTTIRVFCVITTDHFFFYQTEGILK